MSVNTWDIRVALRTHLMELAGIPPINWEGKKYQPTQDNSGNINTYVRETLSIEDEEVWVLEERRATGVYLLEVVSGIDKSSEAEGVAESIKDHFVPGTHEQGVTMRRAFVGQLQTEPPQVTIPVEIDFTAFDMVWPSNVVLWNSVRVTYNGNFVIYNG